MSVKAMFFDFSDGPDACKTVSPSNVRNNITTTSVLTPVGGDSNASKCVLPLENNSVSTNTGLVLNEVDV